MFGSDGGFYVHAVAELQVAAPIGEGGGHSFAGNADHHGAEAHVVAALVADTVLHDQLGAVRAGAEHGDPGAVPIHLDGGVGAFVPGGLRLLIADKIIAVPAVIAAGGGQLHRVFLPSDKLPANNFNHHIFFQRVFPLAPA